MRRSFTSRFLANEGAAIAPMYAVGIAVIVSMSAIGFDYGRLMALDTELQNASDQAALAAATQLDGRDDAITRARDAATAALATASSAFVNETRFANDGAGRPITSLTFQFYDGYEDDAPGALLDDDQGDEAQVVQVTVNARQVFYALTPLVGAINSGNVIGRAMAGLEESTCNVAPLFFCVPTDGEDNPIKSFPSTTDVGKGMMLHFKQNQSNGDNDNGGVDWAPGNFGFIDIDWGTGDDKNRRLGLNSSVQSCVGDGLESRTGFRTPEGDALNTRLDLYSSPLKPDSCNTTTGDFCPAPNVRKDWVRQEFHKNVKGSDLAGLTCDPAHKDSDSTWMRVADVPVTLAQNPGYPLDNCFSGDCSIIGDANWSSASWISAVHGSTASVPDLDGNGSISRFEVYSWELLDPTNRLAKSKVGDNFPTSPVNGTKYDVNLYCSYPQPLVSESALPASETQKDRRLLTAAAVDCSDLNGSAKIDILRWVDLFLVRPTNTVGSEDKFFFTEIVGPGTPPDGSDGFQAFSRQKAVLIR